MSLAAFSLVVVFLYGNMIWGILPVLPHISWESHLMGAIAGLVMAIYYKNLGPQKQAINGKKKKKKKWNNNMRKVYLLKLLKHRQIAKL